ncbi:hypothetical protein [Roseovarius mucosus]|uniref:hypothetical protein n=1 Tax=Roseovarius mucosus TaxID=215743 RepID=UPI003F70AF14
MAAFKGTFYLKSVILFAVFFYLRFAGYIGPAQACSQIIGKFALASIDIGSPTDYERAELEFAQGPNIFPTQGKPVHPTS